MKYLFLDANIYLHCIDYEQLPWSEIINTTEDITVVVPPITRTEIDKIKDKGTGKVNKKAKDISKRFREVFLDDIQRSIPMILCDAPKSDDYEEYGLDKDVQDNQFVLSAILFQKNIEGDVLIVARDTNLLITAKNHELARLFLSDEYCLKPELSEDEKKLQEVQKELEQYKNRSSKPQLVFENGEQILRLRKPVLQETETLIQIAIGEERTKVPFYQNGDDSSKPVNLSTALPLELAMSNVLKHSSEEIKRYNKEVEEYHQEFEEWITLKINRDIVESRIYNLKLILLNNGNAPTGDLNVFIDFPNHINLYNENSKQPFDATTPPIKPAQPSFFRSVISRDLMKSLSLQDHQGLNLSPWGYIDRRPRIWDLEKIINKREYHITRESLPQTMRYNSALDDDVYIDLMQCGNFAIKYSIVDTSLPKRIEGVLSVVVE